MQYATAIAYGGELVEATNCDYEDYRKLGLLCPCCKEPVFVRKDFNRKNSDKKVPSCFAHFKTKNKEEGLICEQRVRAITKAEFEHYQSVARGQRLKKLEDHFLSIFFREFKQIEKLNVYYNNLNNDEVEIEKALNTPLLAIIWVGSIKPIDAVKVRKKYFDSLLVFDLVETIFSVVSFTVSTFSSNKKFVVDIMIFLFSPNNKELLYKILGFLVINQLLISEKARLNCLQSLIKTNSGFVDNKKIISKALKNIALNIMNNLQYYLEKINWQEELQNIND